MGSAMKNHRYAIREDALSRKPAGSFRDSMLSLRVCYKIVSVHSSTLSWYKNSSAGSLMVSGETGVCITQPFSGSQCVPVS